MDNKLGNIEVDFAIPTDNTKDCDLAYYGNKIISLRDKFIFYRFKLDEYEECNINFLKNHIKIKELYKSSCDILSKRLTILQHEFECFLVISNIRDTDIFNQYINLKTDNVSKKYKDLIINYLNNLNKNNDIKGMAKLLANIDNIHINEVNKLMVRKESNGLSKLVFSDTIKEYIKGIDEENNEVKYIDPEINMLIYTNTTNEMVEKNLNCELDKFVFNKKKLN